MSSAGRREERALALAVALYLILFALKLAAYSVTGVMALLAEAFHTLADIFTSGFLLLALVWSRRAADEVHMFGYGRAQNAAALVAATLFVSFTSLRLYEEAIPKLFAAEDASYDQLWLAFGVIAVSMLVVAAPLASLLRQKQRGAAAKAQVRELMNDELGLAAALVGAIAISLDEPIGDPIASIFVATFIGVQAVGLFRENLSFLVGRSPGAEFLAEIRRTALSVPGVEEVGELRAEMVGPETVHAGMVIAVRSGLSIDEADRIGEEVRRRVHEHVTPGYCVISVKPETGMRQNLDAGLPAPGG